jgi:hypothetical protein
MSGGQTPRRGSGKPLKYLSNLILGTTCRYHMPYVVADVVGQVEVANRSAGGSGRPLPNAPVKGVALCESSYRTK